MKRSKPQALVFRHLKSKKSPYVTVSIRISKDQVDYLKANNIEISPLVREMLEGIIKDMKDE